MKINSVELEEIVPSSSTDVLIGSDQLNLVADVRIELKVELGSATLTVKELYALRVDGILKLDTKVDEELKVLLNGKIVARGNLVAIEDSFGVQLTNIAR